MYTRNILEKHLARSRKKNKKIRKSKPIRKDRRNCPMVKLIKKKKLSKGKEFLRRKT